MTISCSYFGRNDDFINSFWNWLTFRQNCLMKIAIIIYHVYCLHSGRITTSIDGGFGYSIQNLHWKWNFVKLHKISTHSAHSDNSYFHFFSIRCLIENYARFHEILFLTNAESFTFLSWKTKKVLFLKKPFLSHFQYQNKKVSFTGPIFSKGFDFWPNLPNILTRFLL